MSQTRALSGRWGNTCVCLSPLMWRLWSITQIIHIQTKSEAKELAWILNKGVVVVECWTYGMDYRTSASLPTVSMDVYASRYTRLARFTASRPLIVMSLASPSPNPTRYSIFNVDVKHIHVLSCPQCLHRKCTSASLLGGQCNESFHWFRKARWANDNLCTKK